jgi:AbiV family abortive infection protein
MSLENISDKELEVGIDKSLKNANELIEEGDILLKENRISRAYCLYQLATEEVGKSRLLFALIMNRQLGEDINYKEVNREFIHHQTKSESALTFEMLALLLMYSGEKDKTAEVRKANFFEALQRVQNENDVQVLNNHKNNSLYVGVKDGAFVKPSDSITKEMAIELRTNVLIRLEAGKTVLRGMLKDLDTIISLLKQTRQATGDEQTGKYFDTFFKD